MTGSRSAPAPSTGHDAIHADARDAGYPSGRYAWAVVALLLLAYLFAVVDRQILNLLVQPIRQDLHITDTQISLLQGFAFVITLGVVGVFMGRVADRGSRRNMIFVGLVIWCISTILCAFTHSFWQLFVLRMLVGVGEATLHPAAYSLIADYFPPDRRGRAVGVFTMGGFIGAGLAMIVGSLAIVATGSTSVHLPLLGAMPSWQAAFLFIGLTGIGITIAVRLIREPYRQERTSDAANPTNTFGFLRRNALIFTVMISGISFNALANFSLISWTPTVFIRVFGWDASMIGAIYGVILIGPGIGGILFSGWLSDRLAAKGREHSALLVSRIAIALVVPAVAWVGVGANPAVSLICLTWCTFLFAIPAGLAPVAIYQITPNEHRGQIIAIYVLVASLLGLGGGPTLVAMTKDLFFHRDAAIGDAMAIVATLAAVLCYVGLTLSMRILKTREADPRDVVHASRISALQVV